MTHSLWHYDKATLSPYGREIFQNILENEKSYSLDVGESWIKYRRVVVDWISEYGDDHKARLTTIHCAYPC